MDAPLLADMASLRELKTKWQIRYRDRSRDPEWAYDSLDKSEYTEAEATDEADWRQHLYDRQRYDPWTQAHPEAPAVTAELTVQDAVDHYVEKKREAGKRGEAGGWTAKTKRADAPVLRQFAQHVGPSRLVDTLRPQELREWVYQKRLAETTRYTRWIKLCAMIRYWDEHDWIGEAPRLPNRPKRRRRVKTTITPGDLDTICAAYENLRERKISASKHATVAGVDWHPDAWRLCFYQGFRRSEVLELRVRNVLLDDQMIRVGDRDYEQKGKRETLIPLVDPARKILEDYLPGDRDPTERIFSTPETNDRVSRHFREAVDHAALQHDRFPGLSPEDVPFDPLRLDPSEVDFYTLRHSCCTYWLRQEQRLIWVNHLMRHADIQTTMEYVHLLPTDLQEMYRGLGT